MSSQWPVIRGSSPGTPEPRCEPRRAGSTTTSPTTLGSVRKTSATRWRAAARRSHIAVVIAADREGYLQGLDAVARGEDAPGVVRGTAAAVDNGIVFVFPGQGTQWPAWPWTC